MQTKKRLTKVERITLKIKNDKELSSCLSSEGMNTESFIMNANRYIKAIKEYRVLCSITWVSKIGTSRDIKLVEVSHNKKYNRTNYYNFWLFFKVLGYKPSSRNRDTFYIGGCGMDMIFHTNYTIIHRLKRLGFLSAKQCSVLAQRTPHTI